MKRASVVLLIAAVVLASAGAGVAAWLLARPSDTATARLPEISAYSHGQLTRVEPYFICNVLNLNDCQTPQAQGELKVNDRDPVQLSVPTQIGSAPWRLLMVYDDPLDTTTAVFRPHSRLAVTIPTVDPHRGPLRGFTVQLLTLVKDQAGELRETPHAEWSVRTVWS
jgi:hypothetical protein